MAVSSVVVTGEKLRKRKIRLKVTKIVLLVLCFLLVCAFLILGIIYKGGRFTVSLDPNFSLESGIVIYETLEDKRSQRKLFASELEFMDNISIDWLPTNIDTEAEGSHNGDNYIAYTFYIENQGVEVMDYWYQVIIDDVIKNVDEAARIMIFINGESTVYAKGSSRDGTPEKDTEKFRDDKDGTIILKQRANLYPGEIDKITVVVWIEGDDPECIDALIGGELKMHMDITEEHHQA